MQQQNMIAEAAVQQFTSTLLFWCRIVDQQQASSMKTRLSLLQDPFGHLFLQTCALSLLNASPTADDGAAAPATSYGCID